MYKSCRNYFKKFLGGSKTFNIDFTHTGSPYFWGMRNTLCKCRAFLLWILMQNNACTISSGNSWKVFFCFGTSSSYTYSYITIWYTGSCCHAPPPKKTQPSIPHYNNYICEVDIQNYQEFPELIDTGRVILYQYS